MVKNIREMNRRSRIRNAEPHLVLIREGEPFHVVYDVTNESGERLKEIGFLNLEDGECVLPRVLGSVTKRNSEGFDIVHKEEPKKPKYVDIMTPGWNNTYHFTTHRYMSHPKDHIDGYEIELTLMYKEGKRYVVSPELTHVAGEKELNKHVLNLFLELFGDFDFLDGEMGAIFRDMTLKRVNWTILPIGEYPFERLEREGFLPKSNKVERVYRHTDSVIRRYSPAQCVVGNGGFRGYIAFLFPERNITVLEHFERGNATYVFDMNWEALSRMTKAQILQEGRAIERIVHKDYWEHNMQKLFDRYPVG